jgi:beta-lactam-binding protein with PASTA domain
VKADIRIPRFVALGGQVAILAGIAAGVFGVSAYMAMRVVVFGNDVEVPRVLGVEVEQARTQLQAHELILAETGARHSPLVAAGQILSQQPPPGEKLKPGRKVKVLVSLGPEQFRAPEIVGMSVPRARLLLGQEGLRLGNVAYVRSGSQRENMVVAQDPPPGAAVEKAGRVDLLVSQGGPEARKVMPDLVGGALAEARAALEGNGFRIGGVRRQKERGVPAGQVLRQFPLPGYPVMPDETISLVVSE